MIMKKYFLSLGLIAAAAFTLTNCTKEIDQPDQAPESAGFPFEITASTAVTKTVAGDEYATNWANNDALSVFHAEAGSTEYGENDKFTYTADNKFTGTLTTALEASKSYDWYAFYPYNSRYDGENHKIGWANYGSTCYQEEVSTPQKQNGNNSMGHLSGTYFPLYGTVSNLGYSEAVSIQMQHLTSAIELNVNNNATEEITVTEIHFTAPDYIVGSFYYNTLNGTYEVASEREDLNFSKTAVLTVTNPSAIPVGESAKFYLGVVPKIIETGDISMEVITDKGTQIKTKTLGEGSADDVELSAGKIKPMTFNYNQAIEVKTVTLPWSEDFSGENPLDSYVTSNVTLYDDENLAGGEAPEILISKDGGYLKVMVDLQSYYGKLTLTFNANNATRTKLSSTEEDVVFSDIVANGKELKCLITVPVGIATLPLIFTNNTSSNVRIDNVNLVTGGVEPQEITFAKSSFTLIKGSAQASSFTGQTVSGAKTTVTYESSNPSVATVDASTGAVTLVEVGETKITATAVATADYSSATASYDIIYSDKDYVSLPWDFDGGIKSDLMAQVGVTGSGLGDDYAESNAPYRIKFDTTGDYVIVKTDSSIGVLTIGLKMLGGANSSSFTVFESADGENYNELQQLSWTGAKNDTKEVSTTESFDSASRYVKFSFVKGSNVGVGSISITKAD